MVREMIAAGLVVIVAGCTQQAGEGGGKSWTDKATSAVSSREWKLSESNSGIDGKKVSATRAYSFAGQNAQFDVEIICQPSKKSTLGDLAAGDFGGTLHMSIKSFVGDVSNPSEASALISETNFVRQNDYSNPAELNYPVSRIRIGDNTYSGPMAAMVLRMGDYSNEAIYTGLLTLGESIPMTIELKNGAGTFELGVDRSSEVEQVLAACGQDQESLSQAKMEQQREQAKTIVLGELKRSCKYFGYASAYDPDVVKNEFAKLSIPADAARDIELDCEKSAPEELTEFSKELKASYGAHQAEALRQSETGAENYWEYARIPLHGLCTPEEYIAYIRTLKNGYADADPQFPGCEKWKRSGNLAQPDDEMTRDSSKPVRQASYQDEMNRAASEAAEAASAAADGY